jgi:hypothetical protein
MAMDLNRRGKKNGTNVHLWTKNDGGGQEWRIAKRCYLINVKSGKAVHTSNGWLPIMDKANVCLFEPMGTSAQVWALVPRDNSSHSPAYTLVHCNDMGGFAVTIGNSDQGGIGELLPQMGPLLFKAGTNVMLYHHHGGACQEWELRPNRTIYNPQTKKVLGVKQGAPHTNGANLELVEPDGSEEQMWNVVWC